MIYPLSKKAREVFVLKESKKCALINTDVAVNSF